MRRMLSGLLCASCVLATLAARADSRPSETLARPAATAAQDQDKAAFVSQAIGTTDTASAVLVGTRWYVFDRMRTRDNLVGGTFLVDGQLRINRSLALGISLTVPFAIERTGSKDHGGIFGNPALWVRGSVYDDGMNRLGLSMTLFVPTIWSVTDMGAIAGEMGMVTGNYDLARYMPATLSLRPDIRYQFHHAGFLVNTEFGFDFMFTFQHDSDHFSTRDATAAGLHAGFNVGYQILGIVTPYAELQLSRLLRSGPDSSVKDFSSYVSIGPGVHVALGHFVGDFYAMIPVSKEYRDAIDAIIGFRLGGRF